MTGATTINEIKKSALCWREKANEIIKWVNRPWSVKLPGKEDKFGTGEFKCADNKVTLDLTKLKSVTFVACDEDGDQRKFTVFGYSEPYEP